MIESVEKDAETDINTLDMFKRVEGSMSAVRHIEDKRFILNPDTSPDLISQLAI